MAHRANKITAAIQAHDYLLYAKDDGRAIRIYRKQKEFRPEYLGFEKPVLNLVRNDYLVMSLTDTWGMNGRRVDWGIEPILARLKAMDLWNSGNIGDQFFEDEKKHEESKSKEFRNNVESFLYDFKGQFAKATSDINTSNLNKLDKRALGEKKLWQS
jgi:hypothetical protein